MPAGAAPTNSHSPNVEESFPVNCNGIDYVLIDAPANPDHAEFTASFVTTTGQVLIPFAFDATQTVTVLTDGAVFEGVTYNSGDVLFSGSESLGIGVKRPQSATCTFGGTGVESFTDDNGNPVSVEFTFSGTAKVLIPGRR